MIYLVKLSHRLAQLLALIIFCAVGACNLPAPQPNSVDALDPPTELPPPNDSIPVRASTHTCDNKPGGWATAFESGMDQLPAKRPNFSSDGFTYYDDQIQTLSLQQSASAPMSPSTVLRVLYPRGAKGGQAPSRWGTRPLPHNTGNIYTCTWVRFSANWTSNGNAGTKLFFIRGNNTTNHTVVTGAGSNYLHAYIGTLLQGSTSAMIGQVETPQNDIAGGGWHKVEVVWGANTPGQRNGSYQQWVDGFPVAERHDIQWFGSGQVAEWTYIWFDPTYGGGLRPVPHDQSIEFDHFYAAVK